MSTMSCPQQLCSASLDSHLCFLSQGQSISCLPSSCPVDFYFSQHYCLLQRELLFHNVPEIGQLQLGYFHPQRCFRLSFHIAILPCLLFLPLLVSSNETSLVNFVYLIYFLSYIHTLNYFGAVCFTLLYLIF